MGSPLLPLLRRSPFLRSPPVLPRVRALTLRTRMRWFFLIECWPPTVAANSRSVIGPLRFSSITADKADRRLTDNLLRSPQRPPASAQFLARILLSSLVSVLSPISVPAQKAWLSPKIRLTHFPSQTSQTALRVWRRVSQLLALCPENW